MSVKGDTTAQWAPAQYTPPFKYGSAPSIVPSVTGVSSGIISQPTGNPNPVIPSNLPSQAYVWYYLMSHMTSWPTYRYAYLFWIVILGLTILYAIAHHLKLSGGSLGAGYTKWGMRRIAVTKTYALPSTSTVIVGASVAALAIVLSIVGNDYIAPSTGTFSFAKRAYIGGPQDPATIVKNTIAKSGWTLGNRFGFMAFAVMPLVVLLAAKAPPFAVFSWKWFTHLYADKLISFHRAAGWLVWGLTTAHVVFWTVQLFKDVDQNTNRAMWFSMFSIYRFVFGCIAYGLLTLMVVLSQRPIRKKGYEFFYHAHLILTVLTLVACVVHHPAIWWWIAIALVIFLGDRTVRAIRWTHINRGAAKSRDVAGGKYSGVATEEFALDEFNDKMLPPVPSNPYDSLSPAPQDQQPYGSIRGYGAPEIQPTGTFESRRYDEDSASLYQPPPRTASRHATRTPSVSTIATAALKSTQPQARPPVIPAGYAQAQLLPSRTIRLTIKVPRPFKWAPGQSLMLSLPEISKLQAHPFTICNNDPNEIVVLIKARKGLTKQLYNLVRGKSEASMRASDTKQVGKAAAPIYVRAMVDGPFGSAGRVNWGDFASVLLVCGGTGVSFGLAVLEHVAKLLQRGDFKSKLRRVRFLWVAREYAEVAWAASALCRARAMVPSTAQLQIDIYVTNAEPKGYSSTTYHAGAYGDSEFAPPRPSFAGVKRTDSSESLSSMLSVDNNGYDSTGGGGRRPSFDDTDQEMRNAGGGIIDYTNYEDEDDVYDPADGELSRQIQKQGKVRRAKSRKVAALNRERQRHSSGQYDSPSVYPPSPQPGRSALHSRQGSGSSAAGLPPGAGYYADMDGASIIEDYADRQPAHGRRSVSHPPNAYETRSGLLAEPRPISVSGRSVSSGHESHESYSGHLLAEPVRDPRRASYRSVASSTYDRYDPYNAPGIPTGLSPSPSGYFDDADSARYAMSVLSRTQSMVFLEDTADQPLMGSGSAPAGLWIDEADYAATSILSESARAGRPKLSAMIDEELGLAEGSIIVGTCGPIKLNVVVRNLVSRNIRPGKILKGDKRGHVAVFSEDFEM